MATTRKVVGYNVYHAPDGCAPSFYGFAKTKREGRRLAQGPSLAQEAWHDAGLAGHCAGIKAPQGEEAPEPCEWFGRDGFDCLVEVFAE